MQHNDGDVAVLAVAKLIHILLASGSMKAVDGERLLIAMEEAFSGDVMALTPLKLLTDEIRRGLVAAEARSDPYA